MNTNEIDDDVLAYLDTVAQIIAGLLQQEAEAQKIGDELPEDKVALLELGQAFMFLYNRLLDEVTEDEILQEEA